MSFGIYPAVTPAGARGKRDAARRPIANGEVPLAVRRERSKALCLDGESFDALADEYVRRFKLNGRCESTIEKNRWLFGRARPQLGKRRMREITAPELLEVVQKVEARGRYKTANRFRGTFSTLYRYAIAIGRADRDPAADRRGALIPAKVTHRAAITDPKQVGELLRAIDGCGQQNRKDCAAVCAPVYAPR